MDSRWLVGLQRGEDGDGWIARLLAGRGEPGPRCRARVVLRWQLAGGGAWRAGQAGQAGRGQMDHSQEPDTICTRGQPDSPDSGPLAVSVTGRQAISAGTICHVRAGIGTRPLTGVPAGRLSRDQSRLWKDMITCHNVPRKLIQETTEMSMHQKNNNITTDMDDD